ncbi:MAG: hypothetical protein Kow0088_24110 [Anaerolineales bacterium]
MAEILPEFEPDIESITLTPSDGGRFEVSVNGKLIYSKLQTGRHVNQGELIQLIRAYLKEAK